MPDNSYIYNAKTVAELVKWAVTEQAGDNILWVRKIGKSGTLTADVTVDMWPYSATTASRALPYTAGELLSIVSSSTADDLGGTGMNYIQIYSLDTDYNLQNEVIEMNGTSAVASTLTSITTGRALCALAGSSKGNVGNITISGASSGQIYAYIPAGDSITNNLHFTVPNGYTAYTIDARVDVFRASGANATRGVEIVQNVYTPATNTTYKAIKTGASTSSSSITSPVLVAPTPAKSTLWYQVTADTNNTIASGQISYLLLKGDYNIRTEI